MSEVKMPDFNMNGKTVIITGGTRGLGYGMAVTLAKFGANVVITSRNEADCQRVSAKIADMGCKCLGVSADSSKRQDIEKVVAKTAEAFGSLNILINNAGISGETAPLLKQTEENFDNVVATNLKGVFLFAKAATEQMVRQNTGGKIINIASVGGITGPRGLIAYAASKAGVINLTKTMANELARYNITVNSICPGYVITELNREFFDDPVFREKMEKRTALRRIGVVEEIAGPVLAFCSDCFSYMTGTNIVIDGGQTIGD